MELRGNEFLRTDLTSWEIGPYNAMLPGPMKLRLMLDGEIVVSAETETGFLHRGLEKALERHLWPAAIALADRLDPEGAVFGELALCMAVEEIATIHVPPRAQGIRLMLSELARISAHMGYVVRVAHTVGSETMVHYALRDREKILDLFELVAGARFSLNFLRFGGVKADVTEGFIERVIETSDLFRVRLKEYNDLFTYNHAFIKRTRGVGVISPEMVQRLGITGPNARAAGVPFDVRKANPYSGYQNLDFELPLGRGEQGDLGDANDRFLVRLREISVSVELLKQVAESLSPGEYCSRKPEEELKIPAGEAYGRVESARGLLGCHVAADGGVRPSRIQFRPPSLAHVMTVPRLVPGVRIEDLPVLLASLDFGIAEVDR